MPGVWFLNSHCWTTNQTGNIWSISVTKRNFNGGTAQSVKINQSCYNQWSCLQFQHSSLQFSAWCQISGSWYIFPTPYCFLSFTQMYSTEDKTELKAKTTCSQVLYACTTKHQSIPPMKGDEQIRPKEKLMMLLIQCVRKREIHLFAKPVLCRYS